MTIDNDALALQIAEVKLCSEENRRTLRGSNSDQGLCGKVDSIDQSLDTLKDNDLPHMEERIMLAIKTQGDKNVTWPSLLKGLLAPVSIAVVISVVITLVNKFFF